MAESAENVLAVIQSAEENKENEDSSFEPEPKKLRTDDSSIALVHKLEDRLTGILCCAVCLDLPGTCFQVFAFKYFSLLDCRCLIHLCSCQLELCFLKHLSRTNTGLQMPCLLSLLNSFIKSCSTAEQNVEDSGCVTMTLG